MKKVWKCFMSKFLFAELLDSILWNITALKIYFFNQTEDQKLRILFKEKKNYFNCNDILKDYETDFITK